ncbi:hypothetical protein [Phytohabitans houttuyneae]|uniref:Uncharacterized protein n=1 Tax=Phytohabitans houttuyneae TaxID=1076126 RepID=A0A6V8KIS6_9ACTN|nr:hypothetical protein [Phytohabitans houttuyneae]GFJ85102.1 hypothetical protein Phou_092820 [Phytohabitans houttuyneae]
MATSTAGSFRQDGAVHTDRPQRLVRETKPGFKTTEFIAYAVAVVAVLIASLVVDGNGNGDNGGAVDYFRADRAWLYIVLLTVGYMISRGLAKSGSRDRNNV